MQKAQVSRCRGPPRFCSPEVNENEMEENILKIIKIKDYYGKYQEIPVSDELAEEWRKLENETQRVYRKEMYHRSGIPLEELDIIIHISQESRIEEDLVQGEDNLRLYEAIAHLTPTQRKYVLMYMENMSLREIARQEGRCMNTVWKSFNSALKKLRKAMEK